MFKKYKPKGTTTYANNGGSNNNSSAEIGENNNRYQANAPPLPPPSPSSTPNSQLVFHCQLAHGSPTVFVSGFANVKELYQKIAEQFDMSVAEILFCTLNTYKVDMKKLLGGQIGLEDFIFAHRKGRPKEIDLTKTEDALGLTITDNGNGYAFIKRIKEGSVIHNIPHIQVGDHIEKLNGEVMVGKRHYEVAKILKDIPKGTLFTIRLVEPLKSGFNSIAPKTGVKPKKAYGSGRETLRFKADGKAEIAEKDDAMEVGVEKINGILENFMGINDSDLATQIWEKSDGKLNSMEFAEAIDNSDLEEFGFTDDLLIEIWGAITDARSGRLKAGN